MFPPVNEELVQTGVDEVGNQGTVVSTNLHKHRSQGKTTSSESKFAHPLFLFPFFFHPGTSDVFKMFVEKEFSQFQFLCSPSCHRSPAV